MPDTPLQAAFRQLYTRQTYATGTAVVATIGNVATSKPAIITELDADEQIIDGGMGDEGGYTLEMLISDFSGTPAKGMAVTCNGSAAGEALKIIRDPKVVNGTTYILTAGDFSVED
jgi:hypothetical protein